MKVIQRQWDDIILEVAVSPGQRATDIASSTNTSHVWIDRILLWLETDGYVYSKGDRGMTYYPTQKSINLHAEKFI